MTCSRTRGGERGASIVEFAILAPVMLLLVMGVIDLARGYQMQIRLENAAREGAAYAQLYPNRVVCDPGADIEDRVTAEQDGSSLKNFDVTVLAEDAGGDLTVPVTGCNGTAADGSDRVRVEATATFEVLTPLVARAVGGEILITGSAEIEVQG
jgi:Flp pilus assembly protein TadG